MRRSSLAAWVLAWWCFVTVLEPGEDTGAGEVTVYVVRHAEKYERWTAAEEGERPGADVSQPLSAKERKRAAALAGALKEKGVAAVFYTEYVRTYETAAPLLDALEAAGKPAKEYRVIQGEEQKAADRVRRQEGGAVLIVAHSHTIKAVLRALGAEEAAVNRVNGESYEKFIRVVIGSGRVVSVEVLDYPQ